MAEEPFFICADCGSSVLAVGHTWTEQAEFEEVGQVRADGRYEFGDRVELGRNEDSHEWVAYCGGCGNGVTVEWLSEGRLKLLLQSEELAAE